MPAPSVSNTPAIAEASQLIGTLNNLANQITAFLTPNVATGASATLFQQVANGTQTCSFSTTVQPTGLGIATSIAGWITFVDATGARRAFPFW